MMRTGATAAAGLSAMPGADADDGDEAGGAEGDWDFDVIRDPE